MVCCIARLFGKQDHTQVITEQHLECHVYCHTIPLYSPSTCLLHQNRKYALYIYFQVYFSLSIILLCSQGNFTVVLVYIICLGFFFYYLCFTCMYVCSLLVGLMSVEARKDCIRAPGTGVTIDKCETSCGLVVRPSSSRRAASTLNCLSSLIVSIPSCVLVQAVPGST